MHLRDAPAFSRVKVLDFGSFEEVAQDVVPEIDEVAPIWTHLQSPDNPFATLRIRGLIDAHLGVCWLPEDARVEIVAPPRFAGQPADLIKQAVPVPIPPDAGHAFASPTGWPPLLWASDLVFSPTKGWTDPELAVEILLCALEVAPDADPDLRAFLLAGLKARFVAVEKNEPTYPPARYPWRDGLEPSESLLEYLRA